VSTHDPFDLIRESNPVDPKNLPGAPFGMAERIMAERASPGFRMSGPALGLASMAFVLVVGAITTAIMITGSEEPVVSEASTTTTQAAGSVTNTTGQTTASGPAEGGPAPWSSLPRPQSAVPQHLIEDWTAAHNQTWCSVLYPADETALSSAGVSRSADFGGGWAVAWDLPDGPGRSADEGYCPNCGRGAYGIAGPDFTGMVDDLNIWPNRIAWEDGSRAGYGLEGLGAPDSGAPMLSYVVVANQG